MLTRFLRFSIDPLGDGEVDLLSAQSFRLVRILEAVPHHVCAQCQLILLVIWNCPEEEEGDPQDKQLEDVVQTILAHFRNIPRPSQECLGIVLSATGSVLNPAISTRLLTKSFEGAFPIDHLAAHFIIKRTGRVEPRQSQNITFRGPDGEMVGGRVEGSLIAATEIEVLYFLSFDEFIELCVSLTCLCHNHCSFALADSLTRLIEGVRTNEIGVGDSVFWRFC
nr:AT-hook motif nuclear-localized protein 4-like isoform X3 [Ipomoea trifida]